MSPDSRHKWYVFDMMLFIIVNSFFLWQVSWATTPLPALTPFHFIIFALAVYRGANIIANEVVAKPLRRPFVTIFKRYGKEQERPRERGFRGAFGALITCPSCVGVWIATVFTYSYVFAPEETLIVMTLLALSAVERLISRVLEHFQSPPKYSN